MYSNHTDSDVRASLLAMPVFMLVTVPLLWRRVAPLAASVAVTTGLLVHLAIFGTDVVRCGVALPESIVLAFAVGSRLDLKRAQIGLVLAILPIVVEGSYFIGSFAVVPAVVAGAVWGSGRVVRSRSAMVEQLETQTAELQEARDERARMEVAADRARVSAELDQLLQRRLGELATLADSGAEGGDASATLAEIEHASRQTLEEMRTVVGALRDDSQSAATEPQPTLTNLEALLVRAKGARAHLTVEGSPRVLPAGVELSAYRIAEHLLAALGDAPDVEVCVRFADDALELQVAGPASKSAKAALDRARERVALQRGTLQATTRGGRAEAVASLPVLAAV